MNILKYNHILFFVPFLVLVLFLSIHTPITSAHEGKVHEIIDSEEQKNKLQECLAQPEFHDSCYLDVCEKQNPYLCAEDIVEAVTIISYPEKAMDVLYGIMDSSLFNIQTDGHLLSHIIGNTIAHRYGFSGESFLRCPQDFNSGCLHGFFEDALEISNDPVGIAIEICESGLDRPSTRKELCYHGIGHIFLFNESYDIMSALSLCDQIPSPTGQERCWDGVFMQKNEAENFNEVKEKVGYRDDDILAPCNRVDYKYRNMCYINHGKYFCAYKRMSMQDASRACLNAGDHISSCITGLGLMVTSPVWQKCLLDYSSPNPHREATVIENAAYLCDMVPSEYIEACHQVSISNLIAYHRSQEAVILCSLYWTSEKSECFNYMGIVFSSHSVNDTEAIQKCAIVPEEYRGDCREGAQTDYAASRNKSAQQNLSNEDRATNNQTTSDEQPKTSSSTLLPYLFIGLGCIFLITPVVYSFRMKHNRERKYTFIVSGSILLVLLAIILLYFLVYEDNGEIVHATNTQEQVSLTNQEQTSLEHCFSLQENRDECYFNLCEKENPYLCAEDLLEQITKIAGPKQATSALHDILASRLFDIQTDGHQLSHIIGNTTFSHYGLNGTAFLRCPTDLNYGCQHGFFEDALAQHETPTKAAEEICESVPSRPLTNKFSCYHGVGHGFLFNETYNLPSALSLCDELPSFTAREGCYQGVFMENIISHFNDIEVERGDMGFVSNDALAPCNRIEKRYRNQCYIQHQMYFLRHYDYSVRDASYACLEVEDDHINYCMRSVGLSTSVTKPKRLEQLKGSLQGTDSEIAALLCYQFPPDYIDLCQRANISSVLNIDKTNIRRATEFCLAVRSSDREGCFGKIGAKLSAIAVSTEEALQSCTTAPEKYQYHCFEGISQKQTS